MADLSLRQALYWNRFTDGASAWTDRGQPPGEDLAALRSGVGREPGTVPALWPHYAVNFEDGWATRQRPEWDPPAALQAEHHALTLYGFHQQSVNVPMHVKGLGLGSAILRLRQDPKTSEEAVDRRFEAVATATTLGELVQHLRRLVVMLRGIKQPLDYTKLLTDLLWWQYPSSQGRVRRIWGLQYYASRRDKEADAETIGERE